MSASNYFSKLVILVLQSSNNTVLCMLGVGMAVLGAQSWPTLWDPMDCSSPGSSIHGILQVRMLEWVAIPFSRGSCPPRNPSWVSCTAGRFFPVWATREAHGMATYHFVTLELSWHSSSSNALPISSFIFWLKNNDTNSQINSPLT